MKANEPKLFLQVKIINQRKDGKFEEYFTKIVDINKKTQEYVVENPINRTGLVLFSNGKKLKVSYAVDNVGIYVFDVIVVTKIRDKIPLLKLKKISEIIKLQRRNFYRVNAVMKVNIKKEEQETFEECMSIDISGGGIKLTSQQEFEEDEKAFLNFEIQDQEINVNSKVVKIEKIGYNKVVVSLQYLDIREEDRNIIVKFVFEKQRSDIKKGNI